MISWLLVSQVAVAVVVVRMNAGRRRRIWIAKHIPGLVTAGKGGVIDRFRDIEGSVWLGCTIGQVRTLEALLIEEDAKKIEDLRDANGACCHCSIQAGIKEAYIAERVVEWTGILPRLCKLGTKPLRQSQKRSELYQYTSFWIAKSGEGICNRQKEEVRYITS